MKNPKIDRFGNKFWLNSKGQFHRDDGPAVEMADGTKVWYINDKRHRDDGPAEEFADGSKSWYKNGKFHRGDGLAIEEINGIWQKSVRPLKLYKIDKQPQDFFELSHKLWGNSPLQYL
jgi:hypothetical protein